MRSKTRWIVAAVVLVGSSMWGCNKGDNATAPPVAKTAFVPDADAGAMLYKSGCLTCHGSAGQGMLHQGPDLRRDPFISKMSDSDLIEFLRKGRPAKDPTNHSGIAMPAGGTIPGFGEDKQSDTETLADVVLFLRNMQAKVKQQDDLKAAAHHSPTTQTLTSASTQPVDAPVTAPLKQ
jgi:mono/diheme cytochrome c family protein